MKKLSLLVLIVFALCTHASSKKMLVLADKGKSNYQIVLPEKKVTGVVDCFLKKTAKLLQNCIRESSGAVLPIVRENDAVKNKSGIYLGDTKFAAHTGVKVKKLQRWEWLNKVAGENIIIAGHDYMPCKKSVHYVSCVLGTVKGTLEFLKQQMNVRFVMPGANGIAVPKHKRILITANLNIKKKPQVNFITSRATEIFYDLSQNFIQHQADTDLHGGHSFYLAVPKEKYAKSHPEYFMLKSGKRNPTRNHLCISNKNVQELMYRAMLKSLDRGNKAYELGQTDGCEACECNKCKAFANTDDWGEKLWVLHRNMAQRLLKDCPDKKVIILSYYGTANPPKTFKKFPENVIVEKCTYTQKSFDDWKGYTVPQGFMAYVYNWGGYSSFGITAKTTPAFAVEQVKLFKKNNVKAVFRCGFGECFGMEGPVYYAYGRAWDDPVNANAQKLSDEYCEAAFRKVAPQMKKFYDTLYERLGFFMSQKLAYPDNPRLILAYIYSPDLLKILEENLESAEKNAKSEKVKKRLQIVRLEFDYASNLAKTLHLYNAYLVNPDWRSFNALAAAIDQRNAMIEKLSPGESVKKLADWPDLSLFGNMKKSNLKRNGTGKVIGAPLTWQTKLIKSKKILPGINKPRLVIKEINTPSLNNFDFNKGDWEAIAYQDINEIQLGKLEQPSKFKVAYDKNNLYIVFNCDLPAKLMNYTPVGRDGSVWKQDCLEIFIDPKGTREKNYHFMFNPIPDSFYDASNGFLKDPLHPLFAHDFPVWNGKWEYNCKLIPEKNKWFAIVKVPFKTLGLTTPKKNSYILMNIGREHYKTKKKVKAREELSLWSPNLEAMSFMDRESYGTIIFGGK